MASIQIRSTADLFRRLDLARKAFGVISTAEAMGLLEGLDIRHLDLDSFRELVDKIAQEGIGTEIQAALQASPETLDPATLDELLTRLSIAIDESPVPTKEIPALEQLFGGDQLGAFLRISPASIQRYGSGSRDAPDVIAARAHFLATVVGELAGAYNDIGIRRWFERRRSQLDGRAPAEILAGEWDPDDSGPERVKELARALSASAAT